MTILVVPEDFRKDQFILKPLLSKLFASLDKRRATVRVCQDPLLGGVDEALKSKRIADIVDRYRGRVRLILLCIDRDGKTGRRQRLDQLEKEGSPQTGVGRLRRDRRVGEGCWQRGRPRN